MRSLLTRIAVMLGLGIALATASGGPAAAHTGLLSSEPSAGQVVSGPPQQVLLMFREPVAAGPDAIRVYDDRMRRVDVGAFSSTSAQQAVRAALPGRLQEGTYSVAWQVISADGHPAAGTLRFSIGRTSTVTGRIPPADGAADSSSSAAAVVLGLLRGLGYAGLAVGPGVLMVVLGLWPGGLLDARTRRLIWSGLGMLGASALGSVAVHATWVNGLPLAEAWTGSQGEKLVGLSDHAYAARFYCLLALGVVMGIATAVGRSLGRPLLVGAGVISAVLLATWPLAGHAVTGRQVPLAIAADLLHLAAMTTWLGGLVLVAVTLSRPAMAAELATMLPRFSRLAFTCVLVLVVTGTYQAWRELGSVSVLVGTPLGRLLLIKTACVVLLVALGGLARRWVQRTLIPVALRKQGVPVGDTLVLARQVLPDSAQLRALRRGLVAELGIGVAVLGVTAVLVATNSAV